MKIVYSPEVKRILKEQRNRRLMAVAKPLMWSCLYLLIVFAWVALP